MMEEGIMEVREDFSSMIFEQKENVCNIQRHNNAVCVN